MVVNFPLFRAEVKKQLDLKGWKRKDLAAATGYSVHSINSAIRGVRQSEKLIGAIDDALNIPKYLAS